MASTELGIYVVNLEGVEARQQTVLWINSGDEVIAGDYIWFVIGFKDENGDLVWKTLKDTAGDVVQITELDSYVTLNFNVYAIKPYYEGTAVPEDLKVYQS